MRHTITFTLACAVVAVTLGGSALAHDVEITPPVVLSAEVGDYLQLEFPSGEIRVSPSDDDQLHASVRFFCDGDRDSCRDRAAQAQIVHEESGNRSVLRFRPKSAYSTRHTELVFDVRVPSVEELQVRIKAGDMNIDSPTGCLTVRASAGSLAIRAPESSVANVALNAKFGDASLSTPDGGEGGRRPFLVGSKVRWNEGSGDCDLRANLTAGEITARLY